MKLLVVDDHPLFRQGLRSALGSVGAGVTILESASFTAALDEIGRHPDVDLVLLDIRLPDVDGLSALERLRADHPEIPVVIVSGSERRDEVLEAMKLGALGFIPKSSPPSVLQQAVKLVLSGGVYLPPSILPEVPASERVGLPQPSLARETLARLKLTSRQIDVLYLMAAGESNKAIAKKLAVTESTVKIHITAILRALNVTSRAEAIVTLARMGMRFPGV